MRRPPHSVTVRVTDSTSNTYDEAISITVLDVVEPANCNEPTDITINTTSDPNGGGQGS